MVVDQRHPCYVHTQIEPSTSPVEFAFIRGGNQELAN